MKNRATLILFCGLPGSGKTTLAKRFEKEGRGVRLCTDEWVADLGFSPTHEEMHLKMQNSLWELAKKLLPLGQTVILENGLWMKDERDAKRKDAESLGVKTEMNYLDVSADELFRRLESRNSENKHGHAVVSKEQIERYLALFDAPDKEESALYTKFITHSA